MSAKYKYSVFIAYHGSYGREGSAENAKSICEMINNKVPSWLSYCGPDTDENTYDVHCEKVIHESKLFLFVVNDFIPTTESGQINPSTSKYIIDEITSFKNLIETGKRNKKDFSVLYTGNLCKTPDEITNYVERLLLDIDPEKKLYIGNQYYISKINDIIAWVNNRICDKNSSILMNDDYYPFKVLEDKIHKNIENGDSSCLILMKKGMGKTCFIKNFAKIYDEEYFIFTFFIEDNIDCSRDKFYWSFVDRLRTLGLSIPSCNANIDDDFIKFITTVKETYFKNKKMLFLIDGIDNIHNSDYSLLSFFSKLNVKNDGLCFIYTSRIYDKIENTYSYDFVTNFNGEKIIFDSESSEYLKFLYDYFNDEIIGTFFASDVEDKADQKALKYFNNIKPKNILSFSILMKLIGIYFNKTNKISEELLQSLSLSTKFYYEYINEEYDGITLAKAKKILAAISLSSLPLSYRDLNKLTNLKLDDNLFLDYPFLTVFVIKDNQNKFLFLHEDIKNLIYADCKKEINEIIAKSYIDLMSIPINQKKFNSYLNDDFANVKILAALLREINDKDKEAFLNNVSKINFDLDWNKSYLLIEKEVFFLESIISCFELLNNQKYSFFSILAFDYFLYNKFSKAKYYFEEVYNILKSNPDLINKNILKYAEFITRFSTLSQSMHDFNSSEKYYLEAMEYYECAFKEHLINENRLLYNWICLSHIYSHSKNLKKQKETLEKIKKRFKRFLDKETSDNTAFYYFSFAYYFRDKKKYKKALIFINECINYYSLLDYKNNSHAFLGNLIECYSIKASLLENLHPTNDDVDKFVSESLKTIRDIKSGIDFIDIDFDSRMKLAFSSLFLSVGEFDEAYKYAMSVLNNIEKASNEDRNTSIILQHENKCNDILKIIGERRRKNAK